MKFAEFERIMSTPRMKRYLQACNSDSRKAMTLYRKNLKLSQELFTIISCFEISLRNSIDSHYNNVFGIDWLRNSAQTGGMFDITGTQITKNVITEAHNKLGTGYTPNKLVAELGFGFWRYLFAKKQYAAGGQTLINILPNKPLSTPTTNYNANYIFNQLRQINDGSL